MRTFADWNEDTPGFMEVDLVAHCGESTEGQYLNTLTCTDICTGWTEVLALRRRCQQRKEMSKNHRFKKSTYQRAACPAGFVKVNDRDQANLQVQTVS
ncbi:MAG: hypothetical protein HZB19_10755 [Chloroflexi bacterium]|nr:hypothetical protein [Chloroflexota bacterium]